GPDGGFAARGGGEVVPAGDLYRRTVAGARVAVAAFAALQPVRPDRSAAAGDDLLRDHAEGAGERHAGGNADRNCAGCADPSRARHFRHLEGRDRVYGGVAGRTRGYGEPWHAAAADVRLYARADGDSVAAAASHAGSASGVAWRARADSGGGEFGGSRDSVCHPRSDPANGILNV